MQFINRTNLGKRLGIAANTVRTLDIAGSLPTRSIIVKNRLAKKETRYELTEDLEVFIIDYKKNKGVLGSKNKDLMTIAEIAIVMGVTTEKLLSSRTKKGTLTKGMPKPVSEVKTGMRLYFKREEISNWLGSEDATPTFFKFITGVFDSADKKLSQSMRISTAKQNKPKTVTIRLAGEF